MLPRRQASKTVMGLKIHRPAVLGSRLEPLARGRDRHGAPDRPPESHRRPARLLLRDPDSRALAPHPGFHRSTGLLYRGLRPSEKQSESCFLYLTSVLSLGSNSGLPPRSSHGLWWTAGGRVNHEGPAASPGIPLTNPHGWNTLGCLSARTATSNNLGKWQCFQNVISIEPFNI